MWTAHIKTKMIQSFILQFTCVVFCIAPVAGQSPGNLNADINASNGFNSVGAIEATYNNARRQEEAQLGLRANAIANLDLPSQTVWNSYTEDKQALYILNNERISRSGINYGQGAVRGYPFEGVAQKVDQVSQNYAQVLMDNDAFTHTYGGANPSSRITNGVGSNCKEFTSRSENLYGAVSTANSGFPNVVAEAMYGFIYDDAGSNWGHREMCLLQDKDLSGNTWGFSDNHGADQEEGLIGIGIVRGTNWSAFGSNWPYGVVLVMNYFDPVPSGCNYTITESTSGATTGVDDSDDCPTILSFTNEIVSGIHKSATQISVATGTEITGPTVFSASEIEVNGSFEVSAGNCLEFSNEGCQYSGDIDCEPPVVNEGGTGTCANPFTMVCGTIIEGNTNQYTNTWSSYGATNIGWTGPEVIFTIEQPAGRVVTITLDQLQADLDLILIRPCTNSPLFASTIEGISNEVISIAAVSTARTLHLVVDGYAGVSSPYRMSLTCPISVTNDLSDIGQKSISRFVKKERIISKVCEPYLEVH